MDNQGRRWIRAVRILAGAAVVAACIVSSCTRQRPAPVAAEPAAEEAEGPPAPKAKDAPLQVPETAPARLVAKCTGIDHIDTRRASWLFRFHVLKILQGGPIPDELVCHEFQGKRGGQELLDALGARDVYSSNVQFDRDREVQLDVVPRSDEKSRSWGVNSSAKLVRSGDDDTASPAQ